MRLMVLVTNTDESDFAQKHPKDGEKFAALVKMVRPSWTTEPFSVKDGIFPDSLENFDGVIITGSPSSVNEGAPWAKRLLYLIRDIHDQQMPMFGACYGHQAIALALGGRVEINPRGWVFGLTRSTIVEQPEWMQGLPQTFAQYGAHNETVTKLPDGAQIISASPDCDVTGFRIGHSVYTTQNHPEMSPEFFTALLTEYETKLPLEVVKTAKSSLTQDADMSAYAETIACFFESSSTD